MLQKPFRAGDWLIREDDSPAYSRSSYLIDNSAGGKDLVFLAGMPMVAGVAATAAQVIAAAAITGAVLEPVIVPIGEKAKITVIERGFNVVNADALPLADQAAGAAYTKAQITAAYQNAILKWVVRTEPPQQNELAT
jgi:hypothetical protein